MMASLLLLILGLTTYVAGFIGGRNYCRKLERQNLSFLEVVWQHAVRDEQPVIVEKIMQHLTVRFGHESAGQIADSWRNRFANNLYWQADKLKSVADRVAA